MTKRYCEMCDEWVKGRECPKCGADTRSTSAPRPSQRDISSDGPDWRKPYPLGRDEDISR